MVYSGLLLRNKLVSREASLGFGRYNCTFDRLSDCSITYSGDENVLPHVRFLYEPTKETPKQIKFQSKDLNDPYKEYPLDLEIEVSPREKVVKYSRNSNDMNLELILDQSSDRVKSLQFSDHTGAAIIYESGTTDQGIITTDQLILTYIKGEDKQDLFYTHHHYRRDLRDVISHLFKYSPEKRLSDSGDVPDILIRNFAQLVQEMFFEEPLRSPNDYIEELLKEKQE
ncbi:hypothetical protein GF327_04065 [Candidatus Woesearchaeota archaeon]|nr:hypothetical protein [Candidatus Woesearchaeota archaeon]